MLRRPARRAARLLRPQTRPFATTGRLAPPAPDPRLSRLGPVHTDSFARLRARYRAPRHPVVLAHGLFGFDELRLLPATARGAAAGPPPRWWPRGIQYWRGIAEALRAAGCEVVTAAVPTAAGVEERAGVLARVVGGRLGGDGAGRRGVNVIA
ncbi:hypothetical protein BDY21DRAFT_126104 [Lineolata rhizophorae]|uniref:Alpha/Beta hydrolase protein n=1 Tax=Lineolata rhizophorae TaxID=578093 RepID=A0A6A6NP62_9PEZI|nr:hypothetical protein BDY21DRAFT_126104 [Lineolata rhizophorae]